MKDELLNYDIAYADATSLQVLNEPGRPAQQKSYTYCIRGGPPDKQMCIFEYNAYSQKDYLVELFTDFKRFIHTDADNVYNELAKNKDITFVYCNAHARRKFENVFNILIVFTPKCISRGCIHSSIE